MFVVKVSRVKYIVIKKMPTHGKFPYSNVLLLLLLLQLYDEEKLSVPPQIRPIISPVLHEACEYEKSLTRMVSLKMCAFGGLDVKCVDGVDAIRHRSPEPMANGSNSHALTIPSDDEKSQKSFTFHLM